MIPDSFSAIRGITARGSWPGSDSRHDDPCPLVTLRGYPAGSCPRVDRYVDHLDNAADDAGKAKSRPDDEDGRATE